MPPSLRYERPYRVRFDECGPDGHLRGSGFLRYAQDLAWVHSESLGFGRDWYSDRRLTWLIRAVELELVDSVTYGEGISVSTEVLGFRRAWARRRSEFDRHGSQRTVALATTDWLLLNRHGAPVRVPSEILERFDVAGAGHLTPLRVEIGEPRVDASERRFHVRRSELDPMDHVNNAAYMEYVDEHLAAAGRTSMLRHLPRRYRVEFVASAEHGEELVGCGWPDEHGWWYKLAAADGRELVRARVETDPARWVGG